MMHPVTNNIEPTAALLVGACSLGEGWAEGCPHNAMKMWKFLSPPSPQGKNEKKRQKKIKPANLQVDHNCDQRVSFV